MRYTREDGCRAWLAYGGMSADVLSALLEHFGSAETIYDQLRSSGGAFLKQHGLNGTAIQALTNHADPAAMHEMMKTMHEQDIGILTPENRRYPDMLRSIPSSPALLFYRGDPDCLMGKCISVIGARKASPQGTEATQKICRELSQAGVTIISGLAMGIDTAAHEGCLEGGSPTAAVLATGIDVDYPAENAALKERIVRLGGVLLSESPPGVKANQYVFETRNRIIAGLSKALVVMECKIKSGCMITVDHALDQGKDVYAYPGVIGTEWTEGTHHLLRDGAHYFAYAADLLEDLQWDENAPAQPVQASKTLPPLSDDQREVYRLLGNGEMSFDQLAAETSYSPGQLSVALTFLQMAGLVRPMPGKCYCRV